MEKHKELSDSEVRVDSLSLMLRQLVVHRCHVVSVEPELRSLSRHARGRRRRRHRRLRQP